MHGRIFYKHQLIKKLQANPDNILFIHIAKNAGTSLNTVPELLQLGHWRLQEIERMGVNLSNRTILCVTRNPYDRLLSAYYYFQHTSSQEQMTGYGYRRVSPEVQRYSDFREFVKSFSTFKYKYIWHFDTQSSYLFNTKKNYSIIYLPLEQLDEAYITFARKYNLPNLPHENRSRTGNRTRQRHYTEDIAQMVYDHYREDFENLGYSKESWVQY